MNSHSESIADLTKALVQVQKSLTTAKKNAENPFFRSKYADLAAIWEVCREPLAENGLAVTQLPTILDDGTQTLTTMLLHESGEWLTSVLKILPNKPNDPQAVGSAITYARRYALAAIVGVTVEGEDDDAQAASQKPTSTRGQSARPRQEETSQEQGEVGTVVEFLNRAMKTFGYKNAEAICAALGVEKPVDIIAKHKTFDEAGVYLESLQGGDA